MKPARVDSEGKGCGFFIVLRGWRHVVQASWVHGREPVMGTRYISGFGHSGPGRGVPIPDFLPLCWAGAFDHSPFSDGGEYSACAAGVFCLFFCFLLFPSRSLINVLMRSPHVCVHVWSSSARQEGASNLVPHRTCVHFVMRVPNKTSRGLLRRKPSNSPDQSWISATEQGILMSSMRMLVLFGADVSFVWF